MVLVTNDLPRPNDGTLPGLVEAVLAQELSDRLGASGARVSIVQSMPVNGMPMAGVVLVHCSVTHLRVGNQALRMTVGFGAGRFNIVTRTSILDLRAAPARGLVSFESNSTTGSMPGSGLGLALAAGSGQIVGLVSGGAGLLMDARQTASQRARLVADSVAGQLHAYFQTSGWSTLAAAPIDHSGLSIDEALPPPRPLPAS